MKRLAMLLVLASLAVGCVGKNGGGKGLNISRTADAGERDHGDLSRTDEMARPVGQR